MKNTAILTIASLAFCTPSVFAADPDANRIKISDPQIEQRGDAVHIAFDVEVGKRAARGGHTVVYRPYLVNGPHRWDLSEIVVQRARARIARERNDLASGEATVFENPAFLRGGDRFHYNTSVPRQGWMKGANLEAELIDLGCCEVESRNLDVLTANIDLPAPMGVIETGGDSVDTEPVPLPARESTGDKLAKEYPFVLHASEFESTMPALMFDDDREDALKVFFAVGSSRLDPNMGGNAETLSRLLEAIRQLQESPDSRVAHVVVAGFASPEGSFAFNDRLAWNRASVLKRYLVEHSSIDGGIVHLYSGVEDWHGLRLMVEASDLADRQAILDIIENVPIWDAARRVGRESELKKLDGGRTYRYLLKNFYPELRKAAYIKVYYENER